jgi:hypothetical protein
MGCDAGIVDIGGVQNVERRMSNFQCRMKFENWGTFE